MATISQGQDVSIKDDITINHWSETIIIMHLLTKPFFFPRVIKFAIAMFTYVIHFDQKVRIYIATKMFQFASCQEPQAILVGPDGFFQSCSLFCIRPSYRDFLDSFAMKAHVRGRTGHTIIIIIIIMATDTFPLGRLFFLCKKQKESGNSSWS